MQCMLLHGTVLSQCSCYISRHVVFVYIIVVHSICVPMCGRRLELVTECFNIAHTCQ